MLDDISPLRTAAEALAGLGDEETAVHLFEPQTAQQYQAGASAGELMHAHLTAALALWLAKDSGEAPEAVVERLAGHEGLVASGKAAEWARDATGTPRPEPLQARSPRKLDLAAEAALRLAK